MFIVAVEASYWEPDSPLPPNPLSVISESFEILGVELSKDHEFFIKDYKSDRGPKVDLVVIKPELSYTKLTEKPDFNGQIEASKEKVIAELGNK